MQAIPRFELSVRPDLPFTTWIVYQIFQGKVKVFKEGRKFGRNKAFEEGNAVMRREEAFWKEQKEESFS